MKTFFFGFFLFTRLAMYSVCIYLYYVKVLCVPFDIDTTKWQYYPFQIRLYILFRVSISTIVANVCHLFSIHNFFVFFQFFFSRRCCSCCCIFLSSHFSGLNEEKKRIFFFAFFVYYSMRL